jgi:multidrug efflux pump subunit AcrB
LLFIVSQGIVVNQALFIIYDYQKNLLNKPSIHAYIKAYSNRIKFLAISLISVVAGLLPVAILSAENSVLSNFASGAIGGLVFSFILVFFFLPITLIKRKKYNQ